MKKLFKILAVVLVLVMAVGCSTPDEVLEEQVCTQYEVYDFTTYQFESEEAAKRAVDASMITQSDAQWFSILAFEDYILNSDADYVGIMYEVQQKTAYYGNERIYSDSHHIVASEISFKQGTVIVNHTYSTRECEF